VSIRVGPWPHGPVIPNAEPIVRIHFPPAASPATNGTRARVVGIGIETADMLVNEVLSRPMRDRRAVARYAGLTGAPDQSGAKRREQGLATAGNARDRRGMIQLSWRFLRFQKNSALALPEVKWSIYPFGGRVPHRKGRESRRPARMLTALGRSCAGGVEAGCSPASTLAKR
jgi:Transposase IS116/IS110/IS902 family